MALPSKIPKSVGAHFNASKELIDKLEIRVSLGPQSHEAPTMSCCDRQLKLDMDFHCQPWMRLKPETVMKSHEILFIKLVPLSSSKKCSVTLCLAKKRVQIRSK